MLLQPDNFPCSHHAYIAPPINIFGRKVAANLMQLSFQRCPLKAQFRHGVSMGSYQVAVAGKAPAKSGNVPFAWRYPSTFV